MLNDDQQFHGRYPTRHLLLAEESEKRDFKTLVEETSWYYKSLQYWGEASSVQVLADFFGIEPGTVRARLAQARIKGYLKSPGRGKRLTN